MRLSLYDVFGNRLLLAPCTADDEELRASQGFARDCFARARTATEGLALFSARSGFFRTAFYNPDGSFERLCGNSLFIAARRFARPGNPVTVQPFDGPEIRLTHGADGFLEASAACSIEPLATAASALGAARVYDTGSPHAVAWTERGAFDAAATEFARERNLNLTLVEDVGTALHVRTFERGVFAETAACGTGALAAAIASERRDQWIDVFYPGGRYTVMIRRRDRLTSWTIRIPSGAVRLHQDRQHGHDDAGPSRPSGSSSERCST